MHGASLRWLLLGLALLALVLVPFAIWEEPVTAAVEEFVASGRSRLTTALGLGLLLCADVFLPVPSSLLASASGLLLGFADGALVNWLGMQAGALLGYAVGRSAGRAGARRLLGDTELERAASCHRAWGGVSLIASRAVPVLAESSVVLAGLVRMPLPRFGWLTAASNAAVALVYAGVGAYAFQARAFLLAFGASILLPGALLGVGHLVQPRRAPAPRSADGPVAGPSLEASE